MTSRSAQQLDLTYERLTSHLGDGDEIPVFRPKFGKQQNVRSGFRNALLAAVVAAGVYRRRSRGFGAAMRASPFSVLVSPRACRRADEIYIGRRVVGRAPGDPLRRF